MGGGVGHSKKYRIRCSVLIRLDIVFIFSGDHKNDDRDKHVCENEAEISAATTECEHDGEHQYEDNGKNTGEEGQKHENGK